MTVAAKIRKIQCSPGMRVPWESAEELSISHWCRDKHGNMPKVCARLLYTDARIHVKFDIQEEYILARCLEMQDSVCKDSHVDFFFSIDGNT